MNMKHLLLTINRFGFIILLMIIISLHAFVYAESDDEKEIRLGKEAAEQLDKELKFISDEALQARIEAIGNKLAETVKKVEINATFGSSRLSDFNYKFKIVDDKDVNAFSLPGGFIYINKGLIDFAESDEEIAGVIAHEIIHASHHHWMELIRRQSKMQGQVLVPLLVALILAKPSTEDTANLITAAQLYQVARGSVWTQDAERDSDAAGIKLLVKSGINPLGMFTFMERLRYSEMTKMQIDWGIYRTHPPSEDRAKAMKKLLDELKVPFKVSKVSTSLSTRVQPIRNSDTVTGYEVVYATYTLYRTPCLPTPEAAKGRANEVSQKINDYFDSGPELFEIRGDFTKFRITARYRPIYEMYEADAAYSNLKPTELIQQWIKALRNAVTAYNLRRPD